MIVLANSTFEGTFYFSQAPKAVDIPHQEEKNDLFVVSSPAFEFANNIMYGRAGFALLRQRLLHDA